MDTFFAAIPIFLLITLAALAALVVGFVALTLHKRWVLNVATAEREASTSYAIRQEAETQARLIPVNQGGAAGFIDVQRGIVIPAQINKLVPNHVAQHIAYAPPIAAPATIAELGEAEVQAVPTFAELLTQDVITPGRLLLGFGESGPLFGTWLDLYSSAVAGLSGSGKTTTVSFLAAQAALARARFVVMDPHKDAGDEGLASILAPLAARFVCDPAGRDSDELEAVIAIAQHELRKRLGGDRDRTPFILAIDELTSLLRGPMAKPIAGLLMDIAQEGRKVGIFALAMGQIWKGSTSGGTEVRDSFASAYVHRMKVGQAKMMLPMDEARKVDKLRPGQALLYDTKGDILAVTIPKTTGDDLATIARLINDTVGHDMSSNSRQNVVTSESTTSAPQSPKVRSAEDVRILDLFANGLNVADIVKEVHGDVQGGAATKRRDEVQAVIRDFVSEQYRSASSAQG